MRLDSDTNKDGINAIARAHAVMEAAPGLLQLLRKHMHSPPWEMAKVAVLMEEQLEWLDADLTALESLHTALIERGCA